MDWATIWVCCSAGIGPVPLNPELSELSAAMPIDMTMTIAYDQNVERRLRSLIHSECTMRQNVSSLLRVLRRRGRRGVCRGHEATSVRYSTSSWVSAR